MRFCSGDKAGKEGLNSMEVQVTFKGGLQKLLRLEKDHREPGEIGGERVSSSASSTIDVSSYARTDARALGASLSRAAI